MPTDTNPINPFAIREKEHLVNPLSGNTLRQNEGDIKNLKETKAVDPELNKALTQIGQGGLASDTREEGGEYLVGESKPFYKQAYNSSMQFGLNALGGFAMGLSSWDIDDSLDIVEGVEKEYGNVIYDIGNKLSKYGQKNYKVWKSSGKEWDFSNPTWWMADIAPTLGTSVGFMGETILESYLLGLVTAPLGGSGAVASVGSKVNALRTLAKSRGLLKTLNLAKNVPKMTNGTRAIVKNAGFGLFKGYQEGLVESYESFHSTYEDFKKKGYSDEEAKKYASLAASTTFRVGVIPNMILNSLQFATLSYNPVTKSTATLFDRTIKNKVLKGGLNLGTEVISEGAEEFIQSVAQKEGSYQAKREAGIVNRDAGRFGDYMTDPENWKAAFSGAIGGASFTAIGSAVNKIKGNDSQKYWESQHTQFMDSYQKDSLEFIDSIKKAEEENDFTKATVLRQQMGANKALHALTLDSIAERDTAFSGYKDFLNAQYTSALDEKNDISSQDREFIKDNFPKYIADANQIEKIYKDNLNYGDAELVQEMTKAKFSLESLNNTEQDILNSIEVAYNKDTEYQNLSLQAKDKLKNDAKIKALKTELNKVNKRLSTNLASRDAQNLNTFKKNIEQELTELQSEKFEVSKEDRQIISALNTNSLDKLQSDLASVKLAKSTARENLAWWSKRKNRESYKKQKLEKAIADETITKEQLVKEKEAVEAQKETTETQERKEVLQSEIDKKDIKEAVVNEPVKEVKTKTEVPLQTVSELTDAVSETVEESISDDDFLPAEINKSNTPALQKLKDTVQSYKSYLDKSLGRNTSFKDFVESYIEQVGQDKAENFFNSLKEGWKLNGLTANFEQVYEELFNPEKIFAEQLSAIASVLSEDSSSHTSDVKIIQKESEPVIDDTGREMEIVSSPFKVSESSPTAAFVGKSFEKNVVQEGGKLIVTEKDLNESLNEDSDIDIKYTLDPKNLTPGTQLTVKIPENFEEMPVTVWEDDITKKGIFPFKEWVKANNVEKGSVEWNNKVPLIAYKGDTPAFFIHDTDWYSPINVGLSSDSVKQQELIDSSKIKLSEVRKAIAEGKNVITVTEKKVGAFDTSETFAPVSEKAPNTKLTVLTESGFKGTVLKDDSVVNLDSLKVGHTYQIRQGAKAGENILLGVSRNRISPEVETTISKAIEVYLTQDNLSQVANDTHKELLDNNIDLTNIQDFENYLKNFAFVTNEKANTYAEISSRVAANDNVKPGSAYFSTQKGALLFGIKDKKINGDKDYVYLHPKKYLEDKDAFNRNVKIILSNLTSVKQNINAESISSTKKLPIIGKKGKLTFKENYESFLKDNLVTNVNSFNIGTVEKPNEITIVQPRINYEILGQEQVVETEVKEEPVLEVKDNTSLEIAEKEIKTLKLKSNAKFKTSNIEGLTLSQERDISNYLFNNIYNTVQNEETKKLDKQELLKKVEDSLFGYVNPIIEKSKKIIDDLQEFKDTERLTQLKDEYQSSIDYANILKENIEYFKEVAVKKILLETSLKETEELGEDANFSKISLEEDVKGKVSKKLKNFLIGTKDIDVTGQERTGFLGVPVYLSYTEIDRKLQQIIGNPSDVDSNFKSILARLKNSEETYPWLSQITNKLENADNQIKNQFAYLFNRHTLSSKFVMFNENKAGSTVQVFDTNATEVKKVIINSWKSGFDFSNLVYKSNDNKLMINKATAKEALQTFESWENPTNLELKTWLLENFGIDLTNDTIQHLRDKGLYNRETKSYLKFSKMFEKRNSTQGVFGKLAYYLQSIQGVENTEYKENIANSPFEDMTGILNTLANIDSKYATVPVSTSFRDGDKTIYGFTSSKLATDTAYKLSFKAEERQKYFNKPYNKHSMLLSLLENDTDFAENKFGIDHVGITSIKKYGEKVLGGRDVTSLSKSNQEMLRTGLFFDNKQGNIKSKYKDFDLSFRRFFFPTMSDKSQMLTLRGAALKLQNKHFEADFSPKKEVLEVMYEQIVLPELSRMYAKKDTNIKGYDLASDLFLNIPFLNTLEHNDKKVIGLIKEDKATYNQEWFNTNVKPKVLKALTNTVKTEVKQTLESWRTSEIADKFGARGIDKKYLETLSGSMSDKLQVAASDYIINNMLNLSNIRMLFSGDLALYSQNKTKKYFNDGNTLSPKSENSYVEFIEDIVNVNEGKRLAELLAPGSKLANSKDSYYKQLFLQDQVKPSENLKTLIKLEYGKEALEQAEETLNDFLTSDNAKIRETAKDTLEKQFPRVGAYLELESTDAQEYTTVEEHVEVLYRQGRISEDKFNEIIEKIDSQNENGLNKSNKISDEDLKLILQPMKPVYNGFYNDEVNGVMRMMYIKSSSFPLIPQLTKGLEIDKLRVFMENNDIARASYQTANKVGSVNTPMSIYNEDGSIKELDSSNLASSSLRLDRDNFRIQQDVPPKFSIKNKDETTLGSQTLKIQFGDGVTEMEGFNFQGEKISGKELKQKHDTAFGNLISLKKKDLFNKLGLNEKGQIVDFKKSAEKLQNFLKREAEERGYSSQSTEALDMQEVKNSSGETIDIRFEIPLWLSPESNKYESLLNAIISNKLIKIKLPGSSFVAGSEAGFKMQSTLEGVNKSDIVFTDKWEGSLKAADIVDNKVKKTQVLLPARFRDSSGKLIDLRSKDYSERNKEGVLMLKKDAIDEALLSFSSFRIPTSSHVSMSEIEVVGFLPTEIGDLLIVPANLTSQKGLDFDIDKENAYFLNHYVDSSKGIRVLNEAEVKSQIAAIENALSPEQLFIDRFEALFTQEDIDSKIETLQEKKKNLKNKLFQKLEENTMIESLSSVLSHPEMQGKISKVLSIDFAKEQAEMINNITKARNPYFTSLAPSYQINKMELGASGKLGIGVYSNYVTFNSLLQQSDSTHLLFDFNEELQENAPFELTLGKLKSFGKLGLKETLGNVKRRLSEVLAERQNIATDNEKEQVMGKVNINEITINVDSLLVSLGFDKDVLDNGKEVSVPFLFLSQPIIKEYAELIKNQDSILKEYNKEAKEEIARELIKKYSDKKADLYENESLTGQALYNELTSEKPTGNLQVLILQNFLQLDTMAEKVRGMQSILNINNGGLGKSFFNVIEKHNKLSKIDKMNKSLSGFTSLIGTVDTQASEGSYQFKELHITPTTPIGNMLVQSVDTAYNLWGKHFPYGNVAVEKIMSKTEKEDMTEFAKAENRNKVFKEIKKFLYSSNKLNLFKGDPQTKRKELFIDTDSNTSLAKYLFDFKQDNKEFFKNPLLASLSFDLKANGEPSLIKYNGATGSLFEEQDLYVSLLELLENNQSLPNKNDSSYTSEDLVEDLVAYSFLEGGVQEAIQFIKHIPVSYLKQVGFTEKLNVWQQEGAMTKLLGVSNDVFLDQYYQHNPNKAERVTEDDFLSVDNKNVKLMTTFTTDKQSDYLSIYDKDSLKKFKLFKRQDNDTYTAMSSLGIFGMSEYAIKEKNLESIVHGKTKKVKEPALEKQKETIDFDMLEINKGKLKHTVNKIVDYLPSSDYGKLAKELVNYIDNNAKIKFDNIPGRGRAASLTGDVSINNSFKKVTSLEELAKVILHETIHNLTSRYVNTIVDAQGQFKKGIDPSKYPEVAKLIRVYNKVKKELGPQAEAVIEKRKTRPTEGLTDSEHIAYAATTIKEMMAVGLTEPKFMEKFNTPENNNIFEKFIDAIVAILKKAFPNIKSNSLSSEVIMSTFEVIQKASESKYDTMEQSDNDALALLKEEPGIDTKDNIENIIDC